MRRSVLNTQAFKAFPDEGKLTSDGRTEQAARDERPQDAGIVRLDGRLMTSSAILTREEGRFTGETPRTTERRGGTPSAGAIGTDRACAFSVLRHAKKQRRVHGKGEKASATAM